MATQWEMKFTVDGAEVSALSLAFQGRLVEEVERQRHILATAYPKAMKTGVVDPGKKALRATIEATGFYRAGSLAKTWRGYSYPSSGESLGPAGVFMSRAGVIVDAFTAGITIEAKNAKYLAVPQGAAKAIIHRLNQAGNRTRDGRFFGKEDGTVDRVAKALGTDLIPIMSPDHTRGILVAASDPTLTKGGRVAKRQTGRATPLFALVKSVTLKPRPMGREVLGDIQSGAQARFVSALVNLLPGENQ